MNKKDITGKQFGDYVTVSRLVGHDGGGTFRSYYKCLCVCGKYITVEYRNLKRYPNRKCKHVKKT